MTSWLGVSNILQRLGKSSGQLHSSPDRSIIIISVIIERLKFAAAYWVPSAGAEATGGKLFLAEGLYNCDLILITLPEGW